MPRYKLTQVHACETCGHDADVMGPYDSVEDAKHAAELMEQEPMLWVRDNGAWESSPLGNLYWYIIEVAGSLE